MEEELKRLKKGIRQLIKHCETWIKYTENDEKRDIYLKINNALEELLEKE